jgi:hypothetical protein
MRLRRIRGVQRRCLQDLLGDVGHWRTAQDLVLEAHISNQKDGPALSQHTQLVCGSRNRQKTPSSMTSFMARQRFRKTANMRFLNSIMPASSFALVGRAA